MPKRFDVERALADDLEKARLNYERARACFNGLIADVPSGVPHPDGSLRIVNARRQWDVAMEAYMKALREFTELTVEGKIPERMKNSA